MRAIRRAAVLGAGTMGSRIAALLANAGIPSLLLDVVLPGEEDRSAAAKKGIENAASQRPEAFFTERTKQLVTPGNFIDDLPAIGDCDWVIEAVAENLEIKRSLWARVERLRQADAILSTNTSGIPLRQICEGFPTSFRRRFLGTHFFNPPRYLYLVELVPGPETQPEVLRQMEEFCDVVLGKGVVPAKDTPNFIGNRIGAFFGAAVYRLTMEMELSIEEVDALTGPLIGLPRSASYRLVDMVGLDVWMQVLENVYRLAPEDPWREWFQPPPFMETMRAQGWWGDKRGQGFYRKTGAEKRLEALNWRTLEYAPAAKPAVSALELLRREPELNARLRALVNRGDRWGVFCRRLLTELVLYAADRAPEIADRIVDIDRAMRWGYGHTLGPFEVADALGVENLVRRLEQEHRSVPPVLEQALRAGGGFYQDACEQRPRKEYLDFRTGAYAAWQERLGVIVLGDVERVRGVVESNRGAALLDLGDGVLCLEFRGEQRLLGAAELAMVEAALDQLERNFAALVLGGEGTVFSAGLDLRLILEKAESGAWADLEDILRALQQAGMAIKYAAKPVVAAPFGLTRGAGAELCLHAARLQAGAELQWGLVNAEAGLLPAGGGMKELLVRLGDAEKAWELATFGRPSRNAEDARQLGWLRDTDGVSMNPMRLIGDAKRVALALAAGYKPPLPDQEITVGGEAMLAKLKLSLWLRREAHSLSDYDVVIGEAAAGVLSGGALSAPQPVSEQYLLDLEREAFLSLCGQPRSRERLTRFLTAEKPRSG